MNENENIGYTVHFTGDKVAEEALYSTFGKKGIPVFKTEKGALEFAKTSVGLLRLLFKFENEVTAKAVPVWMA